MGRLIGLILIGVTGCLGDPDSSDGLRINPEASVVRPGIVIGEVTEGSPEYLFGDVRSVAVDRNDIVYVGDRIGAVVRAYSPQGEFLAEIAAEGEGPGELYGWPSDLTFGPEGRLYVRDGSRITVFRTRVGGTVADSLDEVWTYPGYGNLSSAPSRVTDDGAFYYPGARSSPDGVPRFFYAVFRNGKPTRDTLRVPAYPGLIGLRNAHYRMGPDGRIVEGLNRVPFGAVPSWWVTERGTLLSTAGNTRELYETDLSGDTLRRLELQGLESRRVPVQEMADSARALEARIDSLPVQLDEMIFLGEGIEEREFPGTLPMVVAIREVKGREIWIERWPLEGGASRLYDIFGYDGVHLGTVEFAAALLDDPPAYFGDNFLVGAIIDEGTGVEQVITFRLPSF